jgi:hypothetical protein
LELGNYRFISFAFCDNLEKGLVIKGRTKMANKYFWLGILAITLAAAAGCDDRLLIEDENSVEIISVTPESGLIDGTEQQFKVEIKYVLLTRNEGEIYVAFNSGRDDGGINRYYHAGEPKIVQNGNGTHTFNVTSLVKNWGAEGEFCVYVGLGPYPHPAGISWKGLAFDIKELSFQ